MGDRGRDVEHALDWLYTDELRHSRMIWRLELDRKLDPPWPYPELWLDPGRALLLSLTSHPTLGGPGLPWYQTDADDAAALELLCALRLPGECEVLVDESLRGAICALGATEPAGALEVFACAPGQLEAAPRDVTPTRLTTRHRSLVIEDAWRPEDLPRETSESADGVRWAVLVDDHIASRLMVQPVSRHLAEIADVATRPEHRRQGLAAGLVHAVTKKLHAEGRTVTYSVHPSNLASRSLARRLGYRHCFTWQRLRLRRG